MPIMFLGGVLDHAVRQVPHALGRPKSDTYNAVDKGFPIRAFGYMPGGDVVKVDETPIQVYKLHQGRSGGATWWLYVLVGYDPPRRHFVDTMPVSAVNKL